MNLTCRHELQCRSELIAERWPGMAAGVREESVRNSFPLEHSHESANLGAVETVRQRARHDQEQMVPDVRRQERGLEDRGIGRAQRAVSAKRPPGADRLRARDPGSA